MKTLLQTIDLIDSNREMFQDAKLGINALKTIDKTTGHTCFCLIGAAYQAHGFPFKEFKSGLTPDIRYFNIDQEKINISLVDDRVSPFDYYRWDEFHDKNDSGEMSFLDAFDRFKKEYPNV